MREIYRFIILNKSIFFGSMPLENKVVCHVKRWNAGFDGLLYLSTRQGSLSNDDPRFNEKEEDLFAVSVTCSHVLLLLSRNC